jgi:hypothetical protein
MKAYFHSLASLLLTAQPALHAATALIAGVFLAAVAAGAPGAAHAVVQVASSFDGVRAHVALALVIAAGGALPLVPMQPLALLGYSAPPATASVRVLAATGPTADSVFV